MSKIIKGKKVGRKKITFNKPSIINEYENIEDKVITLPKIISEDYGYEMHFGIEEVKQPRERTYLHTKYTPLYRK